MHVSKAIKNLHAAGISADKGVGRGIHLGDTIIGTKGRVAFEAPAAEVLINAHRELEKLVMTGRQQRIKEMLAGPYGDLVHEGQHLDPVCRDIEALFVNSQARVTGEVRVLYRPGNAFVEGVYDKLAKVYDLIFGPTLHPGRLQAIKRMDIQPGERVLEVGYDHMEGTRFRHTAQFKRWRPDRDPTSCGYAQLEEPVGYDLGKVLSTGE